MTKVVVIGDTTADFLLELPRALQHKLVNQGKIELPLGEKIGLSDYQLMSGGGGANIGVGLKRLGINTELVTTLGVDSIGDELLGRLKDQLKVHVIPVEQTAVSMIIHSSGDRAILTSHPMDNFKGKVDVPPADWLMVAPLPDPADGAISAITSHLIHHQSRLAINPSRAMIERRSREFLALLRQAEILFINKEEGLSLTRLSWQNDIDELAKALTHLGPKIVCLTDGAKGALAQSGAIKRFARRLTNATEVVDSTGAGDAFASGFLAGYILGQKATLAEGELIEQAFSYALLNSASVVTQIGAQSGLRTPEEIERELRYVKLEVR